MIIPSQIPAAPKFCAKIGIRGLTNPNPNVDSTSINKNSFVLNLLITPKQIQKIDTRLLW